jgi:hypothetical protein
VLRILEVACQVYDAVVVDAPRHRRAWTLDVLSGSDELLVVSELTVPALLAARSLAGEIEAELPDGPPPRIVLNRLAKRVFGPAPFDGRGREGAGSPRRRRDHLGLGGRRRLGQPRRSDQPSTGPSRGSSRTPAIWSTG